MDKLVAVIYQDCDIENKQHIVGKTVSREVNCTRTRIIIPNKMLCVALRESQDIE